MAEYAICLKSCFCVVVVVGHLENPEMMMIIPHWDIGYHHGHLWMVMVNVEKNGVVFVM